MNKNKIDLIRQALGAAESSIKLAKQLLAEIEGGASPSKQRAQELPGINGIFDGENMVSESRENFPVPANYASKSMLVVGDTLKLVDEGKEKRFKQIEHVKRHKTLGILAKKDGKWRVVTPEGSYKVLPAAVAHFGAEVGSEVVLHLPADNLTVPYGAIESVKGQKESADKTPGEVFKEESKEEPVNSNALPVRKEKVSGGESSVVERKTEPKIEEAISVEAKKSEPVKAEAKKEETKLVKPTASEVKNVEEPKKVEAAPALKPVSAPTTLKAVSAAPEPKEEKKPEPKVEPAAASSPMVVTEEEELT